MTRKQLVTMVTMATATVAVFVVTAGAMQAKQFGPGGRGGGGRFGGPGPGGPGGFGGPMGPMMGLPRGLADELEVTDAQHEQIRGILEQHRAEGQQLGERLHKAMQAQMAAVSSETFDENAIRAAASEVAAAQVEMAVLHGRVHAVVYQVLTPEQQAKARDLKSKREARMQERAKRVQERRQERRPQRAPAE